MRVSDPMRTAIMSFATCSPRRTPASYRSATMLALDRRLRPRAYGERAPLRAHYFADPFIFSGA